MVSTPPITPAEVVRIIRRRPLAIAAVAAALGACAAAFIAAMPDVYLARAVVHVEAARLPESYKKTGSLAPKLSQLVGILRQEVLSREVIRDVVNELGLYENPALDPTASGPRSWLARLRYRDPIERARRDIRVDIVKRFGEDYVEIAVEARRGDLAARAVNRFCDLLSQKNREFRLRQEEEARAFLESRLVPAQRHLAETEAALVRFREANVDTLPENSALLLDRLGKIRFENEERRQQLARARKEIADIDARIAAIVEAGRPIGASPEREAIEAELRKLEAEEADLVARNYGPTMPALVKVRGKMEALRRQLDEIVAARLESTEPAPSASGREGPSGPTATAASASARDEAAIFAELRRRRAPPETFAQVQALLLRIAEQSAIVDSIEREIERQSAEMARLDMLKASLGATRSKLEKLQASYEDALAEQRALVGDLRDIEKLIATEEAGRTDQFRTIEAAETPLVPVGPNRLLYAALALAASLAGGFGAAYGLEMFQRTYAEPGQIEEDLGLPVLAVIAEGQVGGPLSREPGTAAASEPATPTDPPGVYSAGQLTRLRHAIVHHQGGDIRTVLVTSATTGEGKTTIAARLAASFARSFDHWALLLEADMRRPVLGTRLQLAPSPGLAGHICDGVPLADVIQPTGFPKLSAIVAGRQSPQAADVVASSQMRRIAEEMRARYPDRYIIVDAPPVLATPEALSLSVLVDGIVLIVRARRTSRAVVAQALRTLPREKVLGVVLNGVAPGGDAARYARYEYRETAPAGEPRP